MAKIITRIDASDELARIGASVETVQIALSALSRRDRQCDALEVVLIGALTDILELKERLHVEGVPEAELERRAGL